MKCNKCGVEITSEKIWFIHPSECQGNTEIIEKVNYSKLTYAEIKELCMEKGINPFGKKKEELIKILEG